MNGDRRQELELFLLAVRVLTRLPVPADLPQSDDLLIRATKYYPAVGVAIGVLGGVVLWVASLWLPWPVAVLLSLAATLLATGAFHEVGFARAAEGLIAGSTRERRLEILRTGGMGGQGALALGITLALKVALLASVPPATAVMLLFAAHGLSRMAEVHVMATTRSARGLGMRFVAPAVTPDGYRVALAIGFLVLIALMLGVGAGVAFYGTVGAIALAQAFRYIFVGRLGGYTGDCLGGTQQMAELGLYLGAAVWL